MSDLVSDLVMRSVRSGRDRRVEKARTRYPDAWERVRSACRWSRPGFDLDDHAARVVLAAREGQVR